MKRNDEIRMTNDESNFKVRMTNVQNRRDRAAVRCLRFGHSVIRHLNLIRHSSFVIRASLFLSFALLAASAVHGDWLMGRANWGRTGTEEWRAPAIKTQKVRWAFKAQEHFVAAPVPAENLLLVSGLGAFNSAQIHAIAMEDMVAEGGLKVRAGVPVWNKESPSVRLPVASSPAVYGGMAIFGDGLHQTDGDRKSVV